MHLVILGTKMGAILKQEVETRADNIEVSAFSSVGEFIKTMAFRSIPQDELYRMWVCEDILSGDESHDLETLEKLYAFLDLNYRTTKVICITKQPYGYKVCSDVFKSTLNVTVCVNSLNGEMLKCLLTKPLDAVVKMCGGKKNDKKISKAIKKAEQSKTKELKKKSEKKKGGFSLFKKDKNKKEDLSTSKNLNVEETSQTKNINSSNTDYNIQTNDNESQNISNESDNSDFDTKVSHNESDNKHTDTKTEHIVDENLNSDISAAKVCDEDTSSIEETSVNAIDDIEEVDGLEEIVNEEGAADINGAIGIVDINNTNSEVDLTDMQDTADEVEDESAIKNNESIEDVPNMDLSEADVISVDLTDVKDNLEDITSGLSEFTVDLPNTGIEEATAGSIPDYNLLGISETYGKATEKVVERVVEKVVEKHVGSSEGSYRNSTDVVISTGRGMLVVTGDRRSGKSELVHTLAMKHMKNRKVLVVDFAQGISGLAIKFGLDNILNFEENRQGGLKYLSGAVDVEHLIVRGGNVNYPLLLNIEDNKVECDAVEGKIEKLLFKTAFDLILVDMPIEYLAGLNKLIPHKNMGVLVCVEGNATGVINTGILLDSVGLDDVYSSVLQDKVLYLQTRGKRELQDVFNEVKQWFDCEEWLDSKKILKL